jgi:hypothetical protein
MDEFTPLFCPDNYSIMKASTDSPTLTQQNIKTIRVDIQCLRAIAIVAIFLFHSWPKIFINGFLGVDM